MALLPVGGIALRLNLFSALWAALSAVLVFLLIVQLGRRRELTRKQERVPSVIRRIWAPALLAGLLCAFSRTLWSQAVVAEVYALNLFLLLLCLLLLARWGERGETRFLLAFAFTLGLSLAHHPTAALAVPAFALFLFWHRGKLYENWRTPLVMLGLLILGLSVYLYLPLRSLANPPLNWGHPTTLRDALAHITRASYGSLSTQAHSWSLLGDQIRAFVLLLKKQLGVPLLGLGLVGLVVLFSRAKDWFAITIIFFMGCGLGIIWLLNFSVAPRDLYLIQVFFIPSYSMVALWTAMGAQWLAEGILYLVAPLGPRVRWLSGRALGIVLPLLAVVPLWANFRANDRSAQFLAADLGENVLTTLEPGALLFTSTDTPTFSLAHARIVEGLRPDVSLRHNSRADIFHHLHPPPEP
jgi:hypothetical protein